jgi:hypothetical protein
VSMERSKLREFQRLWIANRRAEWINANGPCAFCGSWESPEVDHIDQALKVTHNVWSWRKDRRDVELAKCRVLCHDCHVKRHESPHGTTWRYSHHGCRCVDCRAAHAKRKRVRDLRRRLELQFGLEMYALSDATEAQLERLRKQPPFSGEVAA